MANTAMLDDFLVRAVLAGLGLAALAGPLGCHIVWQRMAYFGDTVAHAALFGVAIALLLSIELTLGVFMAAAAVAIVLTRMSGHGGMPADTSLGILAHGSLAIGLVLLALIPGARADLVNILIGDILAVSPVDIGLIAITAAAVLVVLTIIWRPLLARTVHAELAAAEGNGGDGARLVFMLLVAATVAIAVKIVGVLLITAMLVIPAAAARRLAASPEAMAVIAALIGMAAVTAGLAASAWYDTPSGPSIVVAAVGLYVLIRAAPDRLVRWVADA